ERIKEQMKSAAREGMESVKKDVRLKADRWRTQVEARISNNPIPATMVGLGLLWIFLNAQESRKRMYNRPFRYSYSLDPYEDWPDYAPELASGRAAHLPHTNHGPVDALKTKVQTTGQ
ncbi:MAG: hypothetical protein KC592_03310, partial [Nitrospira sp.]|nr:hypothetical protein [Nitrospira sp.]